MPAKLATYEARYSPSPLSSTRHRTAECVLDLPAFLTSTSKASPPVQLERQLSSGLRLRLALDTCHWLLKPATPIRIPHLAAM